MTDANILIEDAQDVPGKVVKIAHISGQLDESNVDEKIQELYKAVESNPKNLNLIFDLENLEYMNSKSIGYLTDLYGKITEGGGQVLITNAKSNILDILQVVGLTQLIKNVATIKEAKDSLAALATTIPAQAPISNPVASAAPAPAPVPVAPVQATVPAAPAPAPVQSVAQETVPAATSTAQAPVATPTQTPAPAPKPEPSVVPPTGGQEVFKIQ